MKRDAVERADSAITKRVVMTGHVQMGRAKIGQSLQVTAIVVKIGRERMKHRIIVAAVMLLTALLLTSCQEDEPEQTIQAEQDKPMVSIDTHKRLEGWTITVYAEEDRVFTYSGDIELGRPREIIVRIEEAETVE